MSKIVAMKPTMHNTVVLIVEVSSHGGGVTTSPLT